MGLSVLPLVWDGGATEMRAGIHSVRIATAEAEEELLVPHEWLPIDSDGQNRFRAEVEATLTRLQSKTTSARASRE